MKNYIIVLVIFVIASSCSKTLDRSPVDGLSSEQAFSSEQNLQLFINSFYATMLPGGHATFTGDDMSDIIVPRDVPAYLLGQYTSRQAGGWTWGTLRNVNFFIQNNTNPDIPESIRDRYTGIARFFRAWFYFDKIKQFGGVPWIDRPLSSSDPDLYKARDSRELVMDNVLADINFACEHITDVKDNSSSTVTRWVALALKSRICLYEGTYRRYHPELGLSGTADLWLEEAAAAAGEVMLGPYSLYSTGAKTADYHQLFLRETPISSEVLLALIFSNNLRKWHDANWTFTGGIGVRPSLNKRFVDTYLNIDGTRFTDIPNHETMQFHEEVKSRDARLQQTIRMAGYRRSDNSVAPPDFGYTYSGYQIIKYTLPDKSLDGKAENYNSIPIIRFAEVLLNYAEAKAELGTFSPTDWTNTIALLRQRAGITNTSYPTVADTYMQQEFFPDVNDPVLLEIRRERGIELVAEGFRYDDLMRWRAGELLQKDYKGIYVPALNTPIDLNEDGAPDVSFVSAAPTTQLPGVYYYIMDNTNARLSEGTKGNVIWRANQTKRFQDHKYLRPIPYNELLLNSNLVQNPGWDSPN